jgi:biopolymer transport protein ExbB/TolQ
MSQSTREILDILVILSLIATAFGMFVGVMAWAVFTLIKRIVLAQMREAIVTIHRTKGQRRKWGVWYEKP